MSKSRASILALALALLVLIPAATALALDDDKDDDDDDEGIRVAQIAFSAEHLTQSRQMVRAFVPTGSRSAKCLVSLNETNFAQDAMAVFCGHRFFQNQDGILITVRMGQAVPTTMADFFLSVSLYQEGARQFGQPIFFFGD